MSNNKTTTWQRFLGWLLPLHVKRAIVMSSLMGRMLDTRELDEETLIRANELMRICQRHSTMRMPLAYSHALWDDKVIADFKEIGKKRSVEGMAEAIAKKVPSWLRYDRDEMLKNIRETIHGCVLMRHQDPHFH